MRPARPGLVVALALLAACLVGAAGAHAASRADTFRATLEPRERALFDAYLSAQTFHGAALDAYWGLIEKKKAARKRKKAAGQPLARNDYVLEPPPKYSGPELPAELAKRWAAYETEPRPEEPPPEPLPTVADFLDSARRHYDFEPERIAEREFKARYAREALALGLTKDQVVRVYALETSGLGTADMQAGIHPITRKGKPISTALGYAQLLAANSINEIAKSGDGFLARMRALLKRTGEPQRRARLEAKIASLKAMVATARSVPRDWSRHVALASTDKGRGIHAVNLDGDIGPWLQVIKLDGLRQLAEKEGRGRLAGAEIELMNLAGPATGLEMMTQVARDVPTTNFFARGAYARNTIVRGKSAAELLAALDQRMDENVKNAGAVEFGEVFDEIAREASMAR
ncbi:MAG: hypothetical protein AB1749_04830 [Pseudomonadota bacterium]